VAIPHWRGCSGEPNRLPRAYHSGDSAELDWLLRRFALPVHAAGVARGGTALLTWLGERGEAARGVVARAAAVSAPLDLAAAGGALDRGLNRLLYTRMFLSTLKPKSLAQLERFPGIFDRARLRASRTFREFDDVYTAPLHGFRDVDHYWTSSSSGPWLEQIAVTTLVLNARNDPFQPELALLAATRKTAPCVLLELPRTGGHVGFRSEWLSRRLIKFFHP
jgi:predicted alpha/beta-fold hydrolase